MSIQSDTKLGRNARCWCGSGKKYKRCHLDRETQQSPGKEEARRRLKKIYEEGCCLHPSASPVTCDGKIIKAHTIQRSGGLSRIARNGHVYTLLKDGQLFDESTWAPDGGPHLVGYHQASTFTGFCARHDNELFAPLEKEPFHRSPLQVTLLGYRAICYELYLKERDLAGSQLRREFDKGEPLLAQKVVQEAHDLRDSGVRKAIEELNMEKSRYDRFLFEECFDDLGYYVVEFGKQPEVMCSAISQATHDFGGGRIHTLGRLNSPADWTTFSLIATDEGGAAVFTWAADHKKSEAVIRTLHELSDAALPHAIIRFTFEFFENTYFSPEWWDTLEKSVQTNLKMRQLRDLGDFGGGQEFPRPDDCLLDDGVRAVSWPVVSRQTSISDAPGV